MVASADPFVWFMLGWAFAGVTHLAVGVVAGFAFGNRAKPVAGPYRGTSDRNAHRPPTRPPPTKPGRPS